MFSFLVKVNDGNLYDLYLKFFINVNKIFGIFLKFIVVFFIVIEKCYYLYDSFCFIKEEFVKFRIIRFFIKWIYFNIVFRSL